MHLKNDHIFGFGFLAGRGGKEGFRIFLPNNRIIFYVLALYLIFVATSKKKSTFFFLKKGDFTNFSQYFDIQIVFPEASTKKSALRNEENTDTGITGRKGFAVSPVSLSLTS